MSTIVISNVPTSSGTVILSTNATSPVVNYLINGNFQNTTCTAEFCFYNINKYAG